MNAVVLLQKADDKALAWAQAAAVQRIGTIEALSGSPILMPIQLLRRLLYRQHIDALVFRYLNDYPSFGKSLIRACSEVIAVLIARNLLKARIGWICHNIDQESEQHHPKLTALRRKHLIKKSDRIFVTTELLIEECVSALGVQRDKVGVSSFGAPNSEQLHSPSTSEIESVVRWTRELRSQRARVGLWIGSPAEKSRAGLRSFLSILKNGRCDAERWAGVVIGAPRSWAADCCNDDLSGIEENGRLLFIPERLTVPVSHWAEFDFIWKPCDDVSLTMTVMHAAAVGTPIIVHRGSFLARFVTTFDIGIVADPDSLDRKKLSADLSQVTGDVGKLRSSHNWERGARELIQWLEPYVDERV